ncbi:MAG TPA: (2Fe-2S)-binding protein [Terriglobales bacterium]|nr:(2Fe-2S)-binding protein [Terriglobales bacterium]
MSEQIAVSVNGKRVTVAAGSSVAVAVMNAGASCRTSASGEPRGPLCGMGICYECRAEVDGVAHRRSCQVACTTGMDIRTDG